MKKLKSCICILLIIAMLSASTLLSYANKTYTWEVTEELLWRPADKYISQQNPPDFKWEIVEDAVSYDLKIYTENGNIAYEKIGITDNYYNFSHTFDTGVNYYWTVKYNMADGESDWSTRRRFRIDPDAYEFTVPEVSELIAKVPSDHPRVFTTSGNLTNFRNLKNESSIANLVYTKYISEARNYMNSDNLPDEPLIEGTYWDATKDTYKSDKYEEYLAVLANVKNISADILNQMYVSGIAYLLSGNEDIGAFAKKALLELAEWDISGASSYAFADQVHREIVYKSAMVYDWVYDLLDATQKNSVCNMIKERVNHVYKNGSCLGDLMTSIKDDPLDSHGWTAIGYLGITAYSLKDDIPEAESWLNIILPLYIASMHPWSNQDGGWANGIDYWKISTIYSKEFIDILALGDVINLYNKAWSQNEVNWALYAYPNGSYTSFGDGNGDFSADCTGNKDAMARIAHFSDNPIARWITKDLGGMLRNTISSYYTAKTFENGLKKEPDNFPLAHNFNDIDWVIMNNSVTDPNRIQLSFKSSPYGSFNHSHGDQNSFIIQSNGGTRAKWLAGRSGYYDYYHSPHDNNITRQSFSHNTITVDGGNGQTIDSLSAKGNIPLFVNHSDFDSTTGEAAEAYGGLLDKFDRNIIYIRPDVFVVVDDLDTAKWWGSKFEWWINSHEDIEYTNNSAITKAGNERLRVDVKYPQNTTATYYTEFESPIDGKTYNPSGGSEGEHRKLSFVTQRVQKTKMIVSMSVYDVESEAKIPETEYYDNYVKMTYSDGTVVLVSLLDNSEAVETEDNIIFKGAAVSYNEDSIMLTNGTYLVKDNTVLIDADRAVSVAIGRDQLSISSDDDYTIKVGSNNDYICVMNEKNLTDSKGRTLSSEVGVTPSLDAYRKILTLNAQKGNYTINNCDVDVISQSDVVTSHVEFTGTTDALTAQALVYSPSQTAANLIVAVYDGETLVNAISATGTNDILKAGPVDSRGKTVKAFVWEDASKAVISNVATYSSNFEDILETLEITIDGHDFEAYMDQDFDPAITTYTKDLDTQGEVEVPYVKATIGNNAAKVRIETEVVSKTSVKKTIVVEYGDKTTTQINTNINNIMKDTYSYANSKKYEITFSNNYVAEEKDPNKIYVDDLYADSYIAGSGLYSRFADPKRLIGKYSTNVTLGNGEKYKEVTVSITSTDGATPRQNTLILVKPTDSSKKGTVIGTPVNASGQLVYDSSVSDKTVANVIETSKVDDTAVRHAYDEATGTTTWGKMSEKTVVDSSYAGNSVGNYVYYNMFANDLGRGTGGRLDGDRSPMAGQFCITTVPEGYEGCEYIAPKGDAASGAFNTAGTHTFKFYITADAEISVWTQNVLGSASINGTTVSRTNPSPFVAYYTNKLDIRNYVGGGSGAEGYFRYGYLLEGYLLYCGAIKGVDYTVEDNDRVYTIINYGMPKGFGFGDGNETYHLALKDSNGNLVKPADDSRIVYKTPQELCSKIAEPIPIGIANGSVKDSKLITEPVWASISHGEDVYSKCDLVKFDVSATNGNYFGIFTDRGNAVANTNHVAVLQSYPSLFNMYGADVIRFPINLVHASGGTIMDAWKNQASTPWIKFTAKEDARVMVFSTYNGNYASIAANKGDTGWSRVLLDDASEQILTSTADFALYDNVSIKDVTKGTEVTIYSPGVNTEYMVVVVPSK